MAALDRHFSAIVTINPALRPRVGNPDELRSNRLDHTLDLLKHRVYEAEAGVAESPVGGVITALNEETVVCAALANKGGINLVVTYEAFAPKMLGALRQEITFARQLVRAGRPPGWLSVPIVLTSHTWENSKNEISHQDPTLAEALLGEMADTVPVVFPPDANAAVAMLDSAYGSHGRVVAMIVPKREVANVLTWQQAQRLAAQGALVLDGDPGSARLILAATGAYQLQAATRAQRRLAERGIDAALVYLAEPARLRTPRDDLEAMQVLEDDAVAAIFPPGVPRVFITHTRPEPFLGVLRRIDTGPATTEALGFINRGGTLDIDGMLFANRTTWAHIVAAAGRVISLHASGLLDAGELAAIAGQADPAVLWKSGSPR
jgi:phosphoketolase